MKIVFLIHDLGQGGAEKVLVNLVNNMNQDMFDITVIALFGGGVNEQFLKKHIRYISIFSREFPGNSKIMKLFSPEWLYKKCVQDEYDIVVSYLEGPSARIVSGCRWLLKKKKTLKAPKLVSWIHGEQKDVKVAASSFRSVDEARKCYNCFDEVVTVSKTVADDFATLFQFHKPISVLYNTIESNKVLEKSRETVELGLFYKEEFKIIAVGSLKPIKGFDRLIKIHSRLRKEGINVHTYILGRGPLEKDLRNLAQQLSVEDTVTFLGYKKNPYKYVVQSDLFVCSSHAEGFSTAATEALIVGTPVCTVEVSGMREMLGNNKYGIITQNNEEALYQEIRALLLDTDKLQYYKKMAAVRGKYFSTEKTVHAVEEFLVGLLNN